MKRYLTASDISTLMLANPYQTPRQLWLLKTGRDSEYTISPAMKFGMKAKQIVVDYWEEETNIKTFTRSMVSDHKYPYLTCLPDRSYSTVNGGYGIGILQCKTTALDIEPSDSEFFQLYCELQWRIGLSRSERINVKMGEIAILSRTDCSFRRFEYNLDEDFYQEMREKAIHFWEKHILKDIEPEPVNSNDFKEKYRYHCEGKIITIEATEEVFNKVYALKDLKEKIKSLEKEEERLSNEIKMALKDAEGVKCGNRILATWKTAKNSEKFDVKLFAELYPEQYETVKNDCTVVVPGSRRLLLK